MFLHGDVLLSPRQALPHGAILDERREDLPLACGPSCGTGVRFTEPKTKQYTHGDRRFLVLDRTTTLAREAHERLEVPAGIYEIRTQRAYRHKTVSQKEPIEGLTLSGRKRLDEFVRDCQDQVLATTPTDRDRTEAALADLYRIVGRKRPACLWFSSPMMAIMAYSVLKCGPQLGDRVIEQLHCELWDRLWGVHDGQLWIALRDQLWDSRRMWLLGQGESGPANDFRDRLWVDLGDELARQLILLPDEDRRRLWQGLGEPTGDKFSRQLTGLLHQGGRPPGLVDLSELNFVGFRVGDHLDELDFPLWTLLTAQCQDYLGMTITEQLLWPRSWGRFWFLPEQYSVAAGVTYPPQSTEILDSLAILFRHGGRRWEFDDVVILSDQPVSVSIEGEGMEAHLHRLDGPSMLYRDGYAVYAIHGIQVPANVVKHPDEVGIDRIMNEQDPWVRDAMIAAVGERFWVEGDSQVLDTDVDHSGHQVKLLAIDLTSEPGARFVAIQTLCPSSGCTRTIRVPPAIRWCDEALAWTFDLTVGEYLALLPADLASIPA